MTDQIWTDPVAKEEYEKWGLLAEETRLTIERFVSGRDHLEREAEYLRLVEVHVGPMLARMAHLAVHFRIPVLRLPPGEPAGEGSPEGA